MSSNFIKINNRNIDLDSLDRDDFVVFRERYDYGPIPPAYYYLDWVNNRCLKQYGAKLSCGMQLSLGSYHDGRCRSILGYTEELDKLRRAIIKKIINNEKFIYNLNQQSQKIGKQYQLFSKKLLYAHNFSSESKLIETHQKWIWFYREYGFWNCLIWFALGDYYVDYIDNKILARKYGLLESEIQTLVSPNQPTYVFCEEIELLKIAQLLNFKNKEFSKQPLRVKKLLSEHAARWEFIIWDYIGPDMLTPRNCLERAFKMIKNKNAATSAIEEKLNYYVNLKKQQRLLLKKYSIKKHDCRLIEDLKMITTMQDGKKKVCTLAQYVLHKCLFAPIAKKIGISSVDCIKFTEQELWSALNNQKDRAYLIKSLPKRLAATASITDQYGVHLLYGEQAKKFYKKFSAKINKAEELQGRIASAGIASGVVKVLFSMKDAGKFRSGDILVTTMTTPDYIAVMKLSAAIITEEGGMTCHAAIVARELGKPCIIGTKIATKVLQDGDLVEVDANKGVIKVLKKFN